MECRVLVIGHGTISEDVIRTAKLIMTTNHPIHFINLPENQDMDAYEKQIEEIVQENSDKGISIITDLLGGSPFLTSAKIFEKHWGENIELITGLNLPMMIEVIANIHDVSVSQLKDLAINAGIKGIVDFRSSVNSVNRRK